MHQRTRIKFCGMTRVGDALEAARLGVDAIGLVFAPRSPRCLTIDAAVAIRRELPVFVAAVALFVDADAAFVRSVEQALRPVVLQFHGSEDPAYCSQFGQPYIRAVPMGGEEDPAEYMRRHGDASAFLLDSHARGGQGGSGVGFDHARFPRADARLILAGGLTPANVGQAVRELHPAAVDVSSGIESAPGIKDRARMRDFIDEVRRAGG